MFFYSVLQVDKSGNSKHFLLLLTHKYMKFDLSNIHNYSFIFIACFEKKDAFAANDLYQILWRLSELAIQTNTDF